MKVLAVGIFSVAAGAFALYYMYKLRQARMPTAEEQAWLDEQLATPRPPVLSPGGLSEEEQKWLDKQVTASEEADMLDDARQAAFAPGEGSSPRAKKK